MRDEMTTRQTIDCDPPNWPVPREQLWRELANETYVKVVPEQGLCAFRWLQGHPNYSRAPWGIRATPNRCRRCLFPADHFFFMH